MELHPIHKLYKLSQTLNYDSTPCFHTSLIRKSKNKKLWFFCTWKKISYHVWAIFFTAVSKKLFRAYFLRYLWIVLSDSFFFSCFTFFFVLVFLLKAELKVRRNKWNAPIFLVLDYLTTNFFSSENLFIRLLIFLEACLFFDFCLLWRVYTIWKFSGSKLLSWRFIHFLFFLLVFSFSFKREKKREKHARLVAVNRNGAWRAFFPAFERASEEHECDALLMVGRRYSSFLWKLLLFIMIGGQDFFYIFTWEYFYAIFFMPNYEFSFFFLQFW